MKDSVTAHRDKSIDIIKGIGITSIVIGHSCVRAKVFGLAIPIGPFVYTYHIMIFLFVAGLLIDHKKYNDKKYRHEKLGKQFCRLAGMFFCYNCLFVMAHNVLVSAGIISGTVYTVQEIVKNIANGLTLQSSEILLGAFWFIPMFLLSKIIFAMLYGIDIAKKEEIKLVLMSLICGVCGSMLCFWNISLSYHLQIALLLIPFVCLGVFVSRHRKKIDKIINRWLWIIAAFLLAICIASGRSFDLSANIVGNPAVFYVISLIGVVFCYSLAKMMSGSKRLGGFFALAGRYCFHIMALHFLVIKIIDKVYSMVNGINDAVITTKFPYAFSGQLWLLYIVFGVVVPIIIVKYGGSFYKSVRKRYGREKALS